MSFVGVTIYDGIRHRLVTKHVSGLSFTRSAPGGYTLASFTLDLPRSAFDDLGAADRLYLTCPRTGAMLWEGWLENPGPRDGLDGQAWKVSAVGNAVLASDVSAPMLYADRDLAQWRIEGDLTVPQGAQAGQSPDPTGATGEGVLAIFPMGMEVKTTHEARAGYARAREMGVQVLAIRFVVKSATTSNDYQAFLGWRGGSSGSVDVGTTGIMPTPVTVTRVSGAGAGNPASPIDLFTLGIRREGPDVASVPNNQAWSFFSDISVIGRRLRKDGTPTTNADLAPGTGAQGVYAHEVAADVVARLLPMVGATVAYIEAPMDLSQSTLIDQLVYDQGVTAQQVLEDLMVFEPDWLYEVLSTVGSSGVRFLWRPWPTEARYELRMTTDSVDLPGGGDEVCNRIKVVWTDARGVERTTIVTADMPALTAAGRTRDADSITLREGTGSASNALRAGQAALAAINAQNVAGTATVGRRLVDRQTGHTVEPHEIEPGSIARIRELGIDVRVTRTEYDDDGGLMVLTLNKPRPTSDEVVAQISSRGRR